MAYGSKQNLNFDVLKTEHVEAGFWSSTWGKRHLQKCIRAPISVSSHPNPAQTVFLCCLPFEPMATVAILDHTSM